MSDKMTRSESTRVETRDSVCPGRPAARALSPVGYWVPLQGGAKVLRGVHDLD